MIQRVGQGSKYKYKGGLRGWVLEWSLGRQKDDKNKDEKTLQSSAKTRTF